jgi:hypothetical protein
MKNGIPVTYGPDEIRGMRLGNGVFSLTRFRRILKDKVRRLLAQHIRSVGTVSVAFEIGRVTVQNIDKERPNDFFIDVSCVSGGVVRWRQTLMYRFKNPAQGLSGFLIPGRRRYAK